MYKPVSWILLWSFVRRATYRIRWGHPNGDLHEFTGPISYVMPLTLIHINT